MYFFISFLSFLSFSFHFRTDGVFVKNGKWQISKGHLNYYDKRDTLSKDATENLMAFFDHHMSQQ